MERPGSALVASILVHAAVILGVIGIGMLGHTRAPMKMEMAVPVSIISETVIEAAATDNPDEELVTEDAAAAPVAPPPPEPVPPEPIPPLPTPAPVKKATPPPLPTPAPVKKVTPPPPTPPRTQPTPPRPATPTPPRREESLDLDALAGPPRPATRPGTRPATGQQGQGSAPRATGPQLAALANELKPYLSPPCDREGGDALVIRVRVEMSASGRIIGQPVVDNPRTDPVWRAARDNIMTALRQAEPYNVPAGFVQQVLPFRFETEQICRSQ